MARLINNLNAEVSPYVVNGFTVISGGEEPQPVVEATLLYGSKHYWKYPYIDLQEYYEYDGTYEHGGVTYFKYLKKGDDDLQNFCILTDTRDFSNVSFSNPYIPVGYILDDEYPDEPYYSLPQIYYGGTTEPTVIYPVIEHHDTSVMNKNGHEYVDLGLPSGALWAKFNVGATGDGDASSFYGDYYAWGETETKKDYSWSTYEFTEDDGSTFTKYIPVNKPDMWGGEGEPDNKLELELTDDAARVNMGGDWHLPDNLLLWELFENTTNEWVTDYEGVEGLNGRVFTSNINGNTLFIPAAGYRNNESLDFGGTYGCCWSSLVNPTYPNSAVNLFFYSDECNVDNYLRYCGYSARAVIY